jgi:tetratricopeptide (TPR) repeat protein
MWATAAFMALGLLAKPMLVTLPCALLLLDFWPLQRAPGIGWWRLLYEKAVLFLLSAVSCATTLAAAAGVKVLTSSASLGLQARLANAVIGYAAYLGNLFWPAHLAVLYPIEAQYSPAQVLAAVALLLGVTVLCLVFRRRSPFLLIGWLWFLGILVPVSSVFQVGSQAYADRFAYIPQLGIFWGVVWAVRSLTRGVGRWLPVTAAAAVLALLASLTVRQVNYWSDTVTLFTHNLAVTPGNAVAESILGMGWVRRGDYAQAIVHYREAKRLMPHVGELRTLLGEALAHTGRNAEAIEELRAAVAFDPTDAPARRKLVVLLVDQGRLTEAHQFLPH